MGIEKYLVRDNVRNNFKSESFYSLDKIEVELKAISDTLRNNFISGEQYDVSNEGIQKKVKYIAVKDFMKVKNSKGNLASFFKALAGNPNSKKKVDDDYCGLYLFASKTKSKDFDFQYVGITQTAIQRLKDHVYPGDKDTATFAYLIVRVLSPLKERIDRFHHRKLNDTEKHEKMLLKKEIKVEIAKVQSEFLSELFVTFYPINNNFLLHLAEPFVACDLHCKWNTFETH